MIRAAMVVATFVVSSVVVVAPSAGAATHSVTNLDDDGAGSLRAALVAASGNGTDDEVVIDPALAGGTITLSTGQLVHSGEGEALTIRGAGVTVDAEGESRVFDDQSTGLLTIEDLTLTGGFLDDDDAPEGFDSSARGSGLRSSGPVTLRRSRLANNRIEMTGEELGGTGAGAFVDGDATFEDVDVAANEIVAADGPLSGGGAHVGGALVAERTTISRNRLDLSAADPDEIHDAFGAGVNVDGAVSLTETLVEGNESTGGALTVGVGVLASDSTTVLASEFRDNRGEAKMFAAFGAGLAAIDARVEDSAFVGNELAAMRLPADTVATVGGGIYAEGVWSVERSRFERNRVAGDPAQGGAIYARVGGEVVDSVFDANSAVGDNSAGTAPLAVGGAISYVWDELAAERDGATSATLAVGRSTFTANAAIAGEFSFGGAIGVGQSTGTEPAAVATTVTDSTFVDNDAGGGAGVGSAVAVSVDEPTSSVALQRLTVVGDSRAPAVAESFSQADVTLEGSVLAGPGPQCGLVDPVGPYVVATDGSCAGAQVVAEPGLGPLVDAGGATPTIEVLAGSPVVDAIPVVDALCAGVDQRGVTRPVGAGCDIGAVERAAEEDATPSVYLRAGASPGALGVSRIGYGRRGDQHLLCDWNGDGRDTLGLYRPSDATWYIRNAPGGGQADLTFRYGRPGVGDRILCGDWNGDGVDSPGVYRASDARWYLNDRVAGGPANRTFRYGRPGVGDSPMVGDWNGDGVDSPGVFRGSDTTWYLIDRVGGGPANRTFRYGRPGNGDTPVAGDWDGDGDDTVGIHRAIDDTWHLRNSNTPGGADWRYEFGVPGIEPFDGDWDGDGRDEPAFTLRFGG